MDYRRSQYKYDSLRGLGKHWSQAASNLMRDGAPRQEASAC